MGGVVSSSTCISSSHINYRHAASLSLWMRFFLLLWPLSYNDRQAAEEIRTLVLQGNALRIPSRALLSHASSSIAGVRLSLHYNLAHTTSSPLGSYHAALQLQPLTTHTLYTTTYEQLKIKDYFRESNPGLPVSRTGRLFQYKQTIIMKPYHYIEALCRKRGYVSLFALMLRF